MKTQLIQLYSKMAEMTLDECKNCLIPYSCCDSMYCEFTIDYARSKWGVVLESTGHPKLPLMSQNGCIAAPHLRPMCAAHTCELDKWGGKRGDPKWTKRYWKLRDEINRLEV